MLEIDCAAEAQRIERSLRKTVALRLHRRGAIIALSGGVDSSTCAALAVRAFGRGRVLGLSLPEKDSAAANSGHAREVAERLGISFQVQDITPVLEAIGCYRERDEAIRSVFSEYGAGWKCKIAITGGAQGGINAFKLVVQAPDGTLREQRLPLREYLQIVAATNFKQRIRKTIEYFHADRLNYAVIGTPNRLEYDQGFFVKNGDGAADAKPIAHLYKTQVYALARWLGLPAEVCNAVPTTDTYSMQQGQDEFYFVLPHDKMDIALWARDNAVPAAELAAFLDVDEERARFIYRDIENKRRAAYYLHTAAVMVQA